MELGGIQLQPSMTATFLELGDATSHNLAFSHRADVWVSYGEETITETNLLEIRRRHSDRIFVHTFPKWAEAKTGADWEWHIVGRRLTARMRVQAKRLQRNDVLSVRYKVGSSGKQQRDLLINGAGADGMKPVYCIYCTENAAPGVEARRGNSPVRNASGRLPAGRRPGCAVDHEEAARDRGAMLSLALSLQSIRVRAAEDDT